MSLLSAPTVFDAFRQRAPWWGGDLQSIRNTLSFAPSPLKGERLHLDMKDGSGDKLWALHNTGRDRSKPLIILIHGLAGCETSSYITQGTSYFLSHGFSTLRLNLRGAGPSRPTCTLQSHAGRSLDLHDVILELPRTAIVHGVAILGFSLGGNMSLKFAAEYGRKLPIRAVATVSAPIDLAATSANMLRFRNIFYNKGLLRVFRRECLGSGAAISTRERSAIVAARNFVELDEEFIAPRNGYRDANDYWENCQALGYLSDIRIPTFLLHAQDDPIVPVKPYFDFDWSINKKLILELTRHGGHVGFHGVRNRSYHLDRVLEFFENLF